MSLVDNTVQVRRSNVYLRIPANEVDRYVEKGYDVLDNQCNVIRQSIPTDVKALQRAYEDHVAEIARLKAEIEALKSEKAETVKTSASTKTTKTTTKKNSVKN